MPERHRYCIFYVVDPKALEECCRYRVEPFHREATREKKRKRKHYSKASEKKRREERERERITKIQSKKYIEAIYRLEKKASDASYNCHTAIKREILFRKANRADVQPPVTREHIFAVEGKRPATIPGAIKSRETERERERE